MAWSNYVDDEVARLAAPPFIEDQGERTCPACGRRTVRQYLYRSLQRQRPSLIGYAWCRSCQRFAGSTGPMPAGLTFDDPLDGLTTDERVAIERDLDHFFRRLDKLWDQGVLPQTVSSQRL